MTAPISNLMQNSSSAQAIENIHKYMDAVCQIDVSAPGTGFLIRPYLVLTCCHILPDEKVAENAYARFEGTNPLRIKLAVKDFFLQKPYAKNEGKLVFDAEHLDFALVALQTTAEHVSQVLELSDRFPPQSKEQVYIIQHPVIEVTKRDPAFGRVLQAIQHPGDKRIAKGYISYYDRHIIHHNVPVAHGSSGAPIFNSKGYLCAFHQGECTDHPNCYIGVRTDAVFRCIQDQNISLNIYECQVKQERLSTNLKSFYKSLSQIFISRPGSAGPLQLPIKKIYTPLILRRDLEKEELRQLIKNEKMGKERSSSYENTFSPKKSLEAETLFDQKEIKEASQKRIAVIGDAGTGKSTFCQYVVYEWGQERLWPHFKSVFLISLKNLRVSRYETEASSTLNSLIEKECKYSLDPRLLKDANFLQNTLVILDGYDEFQPEKKFISDLFDKVLETFPHILVTSRPQTLPSELKVIFKIETVGFNRDKTASYIDQFFKALSDQAKEIDLLQAKEKSQTLKSQLDKQKLVGRLAYTPLHLALLCTAFNDEPDFFSQEIIGIADFYDRVLNWMYRRYMRNCLNHYNVATLSKPFNYRTDQDVSEIQKTLEDIAWEATQSKQLYISEEEVKAALRQGVGIDHLRQVGFFRYEDELKLGYFAHLTFQEFFMAIQLAALYLDSQRQSERTELVSQWKLDPHYRLILVMVTGYLDKVPKNKKPATSFINYLDKAPRSQIEPLNAFIKDLWEGPKDEAETYELNLLAKCFEEIKDPQGLPEYDLFINQVCKYLANSNFSQLSINLLKQNYHLLHHPKVIEWMKANYTTPSKEMKWVVHSLSQAGCSFSKEWLDFLIESFQVESKQGFETYLTGVSLQEIVEQGQELTESQIVVLLEILLNNRTLQKPKSIIQNIIQTYVKHAMELPRDVDIIFAIVSRAQISQDIYTQAVVAAILKEITGKYPHLSSKLSPYFQDMPIRSQLGNLVLRKSLTSTPLPDSDLNFLFLLSSSDNDSASHAAFLSLLSTNPVSPSIVKQSASALIFNEAQIRSQFSEQYFKQLEELIALKDRDTENGLIQAICTLVMKGQAISSQTWKNLLDFMETSFIDKTQTNNQIYFVKLNIIGSIHFMWRMKKDLPLRALDCILQQLSRKEKQLQTVTLQALESGIDNYMHLASERIIKTLDCVEIDKSDRDTELLQGGLIRSSQQKIKRANVRGIEIRDSVASNSFPLLSLVNKENLTTQDIILLLKILAGPQEETYDKLLAFNILERNTNLEFTSELLPDQIRLLGYFTGNPYIKTNDNLTSLSISLQKLFIE